MSLIDTFASFASNNAEKGLIAASAISNYKSPVKSPSVNASINIKNKPLSSFSVEAKGEDVKATRDKRLDFKTGLLIVGIVAVSGFLIIRKTEQKVREWEK